jgi:hypothetical protein
LPDDDDDGPDPLSVELPPLLLLSDFDLSDFEPSDFEPSDFELSDLSPPLSAAADFLYESLR